MKIERDFKIGDKVDVINETLTGTVIEVKSGSITVMCNGTI